MPKRKLSSFCKHPDRENIACNFCRYENTTVEKVVLAALNLTVFLIVVGIFASSLIFQAFIHGDWRCAFAQCRIETK